MLAPIYCGEVVTTLQPHGRATVLVRAVARPTLLKRKRPATKASTLRAESVLRLKVMTAFVSLARQIEALKLDLGAIFLLRMGFTALRY